MKNITKVISGIVGVVGALAGISSLTACTEEEDPPTPEYGMPAFYADCKATDNYEACVACCEQSDDAYACVEDYVKNGFCADATNKYGPLVPDAPVYGPPE